MEKINFEFDVNEVNIILEGLSELPAKKSFLVINKIYDAVNAVKAKTEDKQQDLKVVKK